MLPGFDGLDDAADLAAVFDRGVADGKILERKFVSERDGLCCARLQRRVIRKVSADALGTWFNIDNRNADVVGGVMDKKVNHQLLLLAQSIRRDCQWRYVFVSRNASSPLGSESTSSSVSKVAIGATSAKVSSHLRAAVSAGEFRERRLIDERSHVRSSFQPGTGFETHQRRRYMCLLN
jgi:hypothetical protein